ncbi:hypothetical protein KCP69_20950 [Salmonella enterica subsp. enterica]|nr:hypothetical protein KCP69_20950 [Salmonella enterica subsp. enterica]
MGDHTTGKLPARREKLREEVVATSQTQHDTHGNSGPSSIALEGADKKSKEAGRKRWQGSKSHCTESRRHSALLLNDIWRAPVIISNGVGKIMRMRKGK